MLTVHNLAKDQSVKFYQETDPVHAVRYCEAAERGFLEDYLDAMIDKNMRYLENRYPVIRGAKSIACGDWAVLL